MGCQIPIPTKKEWKESTSPNLDSVYTTVLGYHQFENKRRINFVKIQHGDGFFYLHTQPFVFTNYNLLKSGNATYAAHALSYLPDWDIIWDDRATVNDQIELTIPCATYVVPTCLALGLVYRSHQLALLYHFQSQKTPTHRAHHRINYPIRP
jgi:hypothetical protein